MGRDLKWKKYIHQDGIIKLGRDLWDIVLLLYLYSNASQESNIMRKKCSLNFQKGLHFFCFLF